MKEFAPVMDAPEPTAQHNPTTRPRGGKTPGLLLWGVLGIAYLAVAYSLVFPQVWRNLSPGYVELATAAFMIRTFLFHAGLGLVAIAVCAAIVRRRRLLLATVPLLIVTLGRAALT